MRFGWIDSESVGLSIKIILMVVLTGTSYFGYLIFEWSMDRRHEAFIRSDGYIETKKTKLAKLVSEYRSADVQIKQYKAAGKEKYKDVIEGIVAQKLVLKQEIELIISKIPECEVPESANQILRE